MKARWKKGSRTTFGSIVNALRELIFSDGYKERSRKYPEGFTRKRKMTFVQMIHFMLNQIKSSTQSALDRLFDLIGTPEIHMSEQSFFDKRLGIKAFQQLYFKRWPVETKYAELKHKPEIENFSGRTEETILQDYYMTVFLSNMISLAGNEVQPVIDAAREDKGNVYDHPTPARSGRSVQRNPNPRDAHFHFNYKSNC